MLVGAAFGERGVLSRGEAFAAELPDEAFEFKHGEGAEGFGDGDAAGGGDLVDVGAFGGKGGAYVGVRADAVTTGSSHPLRRPAPE